MKRIGRFVDPDVMMERFRKEAEDKERRRLEALELKEDAKVIRLPVWSDAKRAAPNAVLRGCLFAAIQGKLRKVMKRELIVDEDKLKIRFTGWQLDQSDLDVWEMALHLARETHLGHRIDFTAHGFLKALGRSTGKTNHEWLKDVFARLTGCCVEIAHERMTYGGNLMEFWRDETNGRYRLEINPKIARLYAVGFTAVDLEDRRKIGNRKPLALWLHGYIASHAKLYPTKITTFHRLSGSGNKCMRDFSRRLKESLKHLQDKGLIRGFRVEEGLVHIDNIPTPGQRKRLERE